MKEYEILGIEESALSGLNSEERLMAIKKQYKTKLGEFIAKIREILDAKVLDDEETNATPAEKGKEKKPLPARKLEKIEKMQEDIFKCACAFSRIEKRIKGDPLQNQEQYIEGVEPQVQSEQSIDDEVKSLTDMLKKTIRFSEPKSNFLSNRENGKSETRDINAYQALSISDNDELNDQKVVIKTLLLMDTAISKKPPYTTDESEKMLFRSFKYMWAYSKLKTPELRKDYYSNIKYAKMLGYFDVQKAIKETARETLTTTDIENPQTAIVSFGEDDKSQLQISEKQRLSSSVFTMQTASIIKYLVRKVENGEITEHQLYTIIDLQRVEKDPIYREKIIQVLTDDKNIKLAQRHLGGYIGEVKEENGVLNVKHRLKHIGLCVQNQREKKMQKENIDNPTPQPQNSGDGR